MTRIEALSIHAYHRAAFKITVLFAVASWMLLLIAGVHWGDMFALSAGVLCFGAIFASVSTDMMSKRIPNSLSLATLAAAPLWWIGLLMGSDIAQGAAPGAISAMLDPILPRDIDVPPVIPDIDLGTLASIPLDMAMFVVVLVPTFLSFRFGLGFGGGDVKLIAAGSLFFGWPLGFDFLAITFLVGGIFSALVIAGRIYSRARVRAGKGSEKMKAFSEMREFPYAPAIGLAALVCLVAKFEGLIQ